MLYILYDMNFWYLQHYCVCTVKYDPFRPFQVPSILMSDEQLLTHNWYETNDALFGFRLITDDWWWFRNIFYKDISWVLETDNSHKIGSISHLYSFFICIFTFKEKIKHVYIQLWRIMLLSSVWRHYFWMYIIWIYNNDLFAMYEQISFYNSIFIFIYLTPV